MKLGPASLLITGILFIAGAHAATGQAPSRKDFSAGLEIRTQDARPLQEIVLPDALYAGVTRRDLGDIRVFNAGGLSVPFALCPGPLVEAAHEGQSELPVFVIEEVTSQSDGISRVDVQTRGGTRVKIVEPGALVAPGAAQRAAYIIDASAINESIHALSIQWASADGRSEIAVRLESSDDLDIWASLLERTTLLRSSGAGGVLERSRLTVPARRYRYLRIEAADGKVAPAVEGVVAHWTRSAPEPQLARVDAMAQAGGGAGEFFYDSERMAPVQRAWFDLPMRNMALRVALDSRSHPDAVWQTRWTGEAYSLILNDGSSRDSVARFGAVSDRWWRVRILRGAESIGQGRPRLTLGYHPARLRFVAQGSGPFALAFGSARVEPAQLQRCDALAGITDKDEIVAMTGQPGLHPVVPGGFGGDDALRAPAKKMPVRLIVLWAVLIGGCGVLIGMAISLLRRLRQDNEARKD